MQVADTPPHQPVALVFIPYPHQGGGGNKLRAKKQKVDRRECGLTTFGQIATNYIVFAEPIKKEGRKEGSEEC